VTVKTDFRPESVLEFWFPDNGFWRSKETFLNWLQERMFGGMDEAICQRFADLTEAAAKGELDHWCDTSDGRLALIIALDQFPRSLWRDTPGAYEQDIKANGLVQEGIKNGHYHVLEPWKKLFYGIALGHCEGPDHLDRLTLWDELSEVLIAENPPQLAFTADMIRSRNARVRSVIERFGRHPHRNIYYGRVSSAAEESYIALGDFPHLPRKNPSDNP